ncbi:alpha/beta hydrolase [Actinokineospora sp. NBRC 105648]|uniref:alpha/beta hydrolase n=1 Tax=Actinokineospora sp. NBRC 105648 TaxID=3032206 RepID=UPI0024A51856|nr:alpha/beta hydrolase [Actinokineospora sp. NBRC 105648]GLZ40916.1 alpha/beta hydrolase [Actinokineospora sp. NBRC 105648]
MSALVNRVPIRVQAAAAQAVFALPRQVKRLIAGKPIRIDGQELALDAQLLLALDRMAGHSFVDRTPERSRLNLERSTHLVNGPRIEPVAVRAIDANGVPARLYTPEGAGDRAPLLVFYHGGGWVLGTLDSHDQTCRFLAVHARVKVLSVDYRLAPEHPFPAAADDALTAFNYASSHAASLGVNPDLIAVGGDSAGGNLAAVTAYQATRAGGPRPAFQLLFYPGTDATVRRRSRDLFADGFFLTSADIDWFCDHYCPDFTQRADPRFSVLRATDLSGLPPAYVATAGFDPLRDEGEAYAHALRAAGVPVVLSRQSDLIHGYVNFVGVGTRFREALSEAAGALAAALVLTAPAPADLFRSR